ncbi:hypothetical protein TanjilG_24355 [Lupinus angustifolius]|uniref:Uncharacterized protein n=1 Tax=Lupinus angustifolius TaxID=3871 RepID=A0A1J7IBY4_LUPAN|nr:hypothetical protein TanjilG_24355 [Lupinus angustifolius]
MYLPCSKTLGSITLAGIVQINHLFIMIVSSHQGSPEASWLLWLDMRKHSMQVLDELLSA